MDNEPKDPLSSLGAAAAVMHEAFVSLLQAGFTESQALYLVAQLIKGV